MRLPFFRSGLSPLTPPLVPKPPAPPFDPHATAAFILKMGKVRRAEIEPGDDDDQTTTRATTKTRSRLSRRPVS
jgi:hypothetical protein